MSKFASLLIGFMLFLHGSVNAQTSLEASEASALNKSVTQARGENFTVKKAELGEQQSKPTTTFANTANAAQWLKRLSTSLQQLNFSTSFVVVKNNHAEPYHWFHGIDENGTELELLSLLNGPRRDILRRDRVVSYIEPELVPYSVKSENVSGPIPAVFSKDVSVLSNNYDFVVVGKSRVLGRAAQLIRIVPKDLHRYSYWLWLDQSTGLFLKLAVINRAGSLLEQAQFTHLDITSNVAETLSKLASAELPQLINLNKGEKPVTEFSWQLAWLPDGFNTITTNRHRIQLTKKPVEFMLLSDGLVDVSVYVNPSKEQSRAEEYVLDGATVALNKVENGIEISLVGKVPVKTAKMILNSFQLVN